MNGYLHLIKSEETKLVILFVDNLFGMARDYEF